MKKIAVIIANGSEELEALTPVDILRRAGVDCKLVSVNELFVEGSHKITVKADLTVEQADFSTFDGIVIPGGMPGATNIASCEKVVLTAKEMLKNGKLVASICASPAVVLAQNGIVDGKKLTCYPAPQFLEMLKNCVYTAESVTVDDNLITANGPKSAMEFSLKICEFLGVKAGF